MNIKSILLVPIILLMLLASCNRRSVTFEEKKNSLRDSLLVLYNVEGDSVKREAVKFLIDNMDETQEVTYPVFYSRQTHKRVDLDLLKISGKQEFETILKEQKIGCRDTTVKDVDILTVKFLAEQIDKAFTDWKNYPWNKKLDKDNFFEYLLPYKVFREKTSAWRSLLSNQYYLQLQQASGQKKYLAREDVISRFAMFKTVKADPLLKYSEGIPGVSSSPYFDEMVAMGRGDCGSFALMNVYTLRSMGIPATIDLIPLFGKINAGHVKAVYYSDSTKTLKPLTTSGFFGNKAKVIRYTYKKQGTWINDIRPTIENPDNFLLRYLMTSHWADVTASYNPVADINYQTGEKTSGKFAYICVFNYGAWEPVFWGKKTGDLISFKDMGTDIIYRIAAPKGQGLRFLSSPFILSNNKKLRFYNGGAGKYEKITLNKVNMGYWSDVLEDSIYTLSYLDKLGNWITLGSKKALKSAKKNMDLNSPEIMEEISFYHGYGYDAMETFTNIKKHRKGSIEFENVPKNVFLKLQETGDEKHLARVFLIDSLNHKQIWY